MGSLYYDLVGILRAAGCTVKENSITAGWQNRSRSSGGFSSPPLAVFWHHTASSSGASVDSDLNYMINVNQDAPVGNMLLDRTGCFWPIAGGASNCAGKGNQMSFSRGTGAKDSGNTWAWQIECQNNGVGEGWSQATIDALIRGSNALNAYVKNKPSDITSHALGKGNGYTDRKIDPATAAAVQGPWKPRSTNSSQTWDLDDMRNVCLQRAGQAPPTPTPTPPTPTPVPPTTTDWWTPLMASLPVLKQGSSGAFVKRMQHLLAAAGAMNEANTANYDGQFGSGTANALNQFKTKAGGKADGVCDPWTWGALMHTIDGIPTVKKGQSGLDVKRMQHLLAAGGYMNEANTANYDGQWGSGTENAKINFDKAKGLTPSPPTDCGEKSWTRLLKG